MHLSLGISNNTFFLQLYDETLPKISARHILVADEETAKEIIAKLDAAEDKEATAFFPNLDEEESYCVNEVLDSGVDNDLSYKFLEYRRR